MSSWGSSEVRQSSVLAKSRHTRPPKNCEAARTGSLDMDDPANCCFNGHGRYTRGPKDQQFFARCGECWVASARHSGASPVKGAAAEARFRLTVLSSFPDLPPQETRAMAAARGGTMPLEGARP